MEIGLDKKDDLEDELEDVNEEDLEEDEDLEEEDEEEEDIDEDNVEDNIEDLEDGEEEEEEEDDDIDVEDIEEEDDIEEEEDIIMDDSEEKEDVIEIQEEKIVTHKKKRVVIQRYCKSAKEYIPRKQFVSRNYTCDMIKTILEHYTTEKNAERFALHCKQNPKDIYQLCGKFIQKDFSHAELLEELKKGISGWDSKTFKKEQDTEAQDIAIMTIKLDVTEGLYECGRCKSKKTYSRQVQTRSADEGMTSIIQCSECNKVWREYA